VVVKPISPYLLRPLRTLEEALRELDQGAPESTAEPPQAAVPASPGDPAKPAAPRDSVTIAGVDVPVAPGEPSPPPTGGQIDIKA
jgi:hypothetical protein